MELTLDLICHHLPDCAPASPVCRIGVQEKKDVREAAAYAGLTEIRLRVQLQAEANPPRFKGPAVQGTPAEPFIYLSWGDWVEGVWVMRQRSKIQLNTIPAELLAKALAGGDGLQVRLRLSGADGKAITGSLKPADMEWSLAGA